MAEAAQKLDTAATTLKRVATQIRPSGYMDYKLYLDSLYYQTKLELKPYSYKKFAADLGFGVTTVIHQIINGYRPLTPRTATRIADVLELSPNERRYLLLLCDYCNGATGEGRDRLFAELVQLKAEAAPASNDRDWLAYCSAWYHAVIRELVATTGFRDDPVWIAGRLSPAITPEQAGASLELLERLQMIRYDKERRTYLQTTDRVATGSAVRGLGLVRYHQEMIDLGKAALTAVPGRRRHVTGMTFRCSENALAALTAMISEFQSKLLDVAEAAPGDEVFQMNLQLFPFTGKGDPI